MVTPLTTDNFEFEKLRAKSPEATKRGNINYYSVPFAYEDRKSLLKIEGNFRVFRYENKEGISYSLAIGIDDKNEEFFTKLGKRMAELAFEQTGKFQNHLNDQMSNWLRLLEMASIRTCILEFTPASLEKRTATYQSARKLMAFTRGKGLI